MCFFELRSERVKHRDCGCSASEKRMTSVSDQSSCSSGQYVVCIVSWKLSIPIFISTSPGNISLRKIIIALSLMVALKTVTQNNHEDLKR